MYFLQADQLTDVNGGTNKIAIASQSTIYTARHKIGMGGAFGLWTLLFGTTPNLKIEMQVSDTAPDSLEGVADSVGADWCVQEGGSPIYTALADNVLHKITLNPTPSQWMRLKITGNGANTSDVTGTFKIVTQQQLGR